MLIKFYFVSGAADTRQKQTDVLSVKSCDKRVPVAVRGFLEIFANLTRMVGAHGTSVSVLRFHTCATCEGAFCFDSSKC